MDIEKLLLTNIVDVADMKIAWDEGLREVHFVDPLNKGVFLFSVDYWQKSYLASAPTREAILYEFPQFSFGHEVRETTAWLVDSLKKRFIKNTLQESILEASELAGRDGHVIEATRELHQASWQALKLTTPRTGRVDFSDDVESRRERYLLRTKQGSISGVPLGFDEIDRHTMGILPGELCIIVGFSKSGKTNSLCHAAVSARRAGYTPFVATLELSIYDMEDRIDAFVSGVPYGGIQRGSLTNEQTETLRQAQDDFAALGSVFVEKPPRGERTVSYIINRARDQGANFLVIDQLSFMESHKNLRDQHRETAEIVADLKVDISSDETHALPCLMAAQLNRESQKNAKGQRPQMHQIGLSSAVEQTADSIYALSQTSEERANRSMVLEMLGNRRGPPGAWMLAWELEQRTYLGVRHKLEEE